MTTKKEAPTLIKLPPRALGRLDTYIADMAREDSRPARFRDSRVYAAGYAVVETYGLLLQVSDPSDPALVREAVAAVTDVSLDFGAREEGTP